MPLIHDNICQWTEKHIKDAMSNGNTLTKCLIPCAKFTLTLVQKGSGAVCIPGGGTPIVKLYG